MHVKQDVGHNYTPGKLEGYFNNLTEKVVRDRNPLVSLTVPVTTDEKAGQIIFPIAVFQYGLGSYDLYFETKNVQYLKEFFVCANWAISNQEANGAWNNFGFVQSDAPYSSMCQGEGCSLLLRAWKETKDNKFWVAAHKAIDFMLIPIGEGGTTEYSGADEVRFYEYTNKPCVLNGWIFSIFGLYELVIFDKNDFYRSNLERTVNTLKKDIHKFDTGFWSMYDLGYIIASPFYHDLHISQLEALYVTFGDSLFEQYVQKFNQYKQSLRNKFRALRIKIFQKIRE